MGWAIQHLPMRSQNRSYTAVSDLMSQAAHELPARHWRPLRVVHDRRRDRWFEVSPNQAATMRDALLVVADRLTGRRDAADLVWFARDLAEAADTAARSGKPWKWS